VSPSSTFLRLFVAASVPEAVKASLREVQRELRRILPGDSTSWTRPEAMHLTMRFLGSVEATQVAEVSRRLGEGLAGFGALDLACRGLGGFPDLRRPHVVWAGVDDAAGLLGGLHEAVDRAVRELAEKPAEARFVGHVTLARPKVVRPADAARLEDVAARAVDRVHGAWRCEALELVRSEPSPDGSRYTTLAHLAL